MYVFNDREGTDCLKITKSYGQMYESSSFLNARWSGTDETASDKRFQTTLLQLCCSFYSGFFWFDGAV